MVLLPRGGRSGRSGRRRIESLIKYYDRGSLQLGGAEVEVGSADEAAYY